MYRVSEASITAEDNCEYVISYFMSEEDSIFGVSARLSYNGVVIESEDVNNLWDNRDEAINCINVLAKNTVTPTCLVEILDELFY